MKDVRAVNELFMSDYDKFLIELEEQVKIDKKGGDGR
jgi:hypothetical protein